MKANKIKIYISPKRKSLLLKIFMAIVTISFSGIVVFSCGRLAYLSDTHDERKKYTIILDPGHGGDDSGAVSPNSTLEKDLNLQISLKLRNILKAAGFDVVMTRETDTALHGGIKKKKKRADLNERLKIIKASQKNNKNGSIFISIHQNNFPVTKYSGSQIFFSQNNPKSEVLAECIRKSILDMIQKDNKRELKIDNGNIFLLKHSNLPSCLIECGFLSNSEEEQKLKQDSYQNQLVFCIFCGICNYFSYS